jgi:hypothetical protein
MIQWLKKNWEWALGGFALLAAFLLGRKGKRTAEILATEAVETKEKEIEVIEELSKEEKLEKAKAHKKYVDNRVALRKQYRSAKNELERETAQRKLELLELAKEDPDEIDRLLLEEFNIARLK